MDLLRTSRRYPRRSDLDGFVAFRLPSPTIQPLRQIALAEDRSVSAVVRRLVTGALNEGAPNAS